MKRPHTFPVTKVHIEVIRIRDQSGLRFNPDIGRDKENLVSRR